MNGIRDLQKQTTYRLKVIFHKGSSGQQVYGTDQCKWLANGEKSGETRNSGSILVYWTIGRGSLEREERAGLPSAYGGTPNTEGCRGVVRGLAGLVSTGKQDERDRRRRKTATKDKTAIPASATAAAAGWLVAVRAARNRLTSNRGFLILKNRQGAQLSK